jgi:hypothetical protein
MKHSGLSGLRASQRPAIMSAIATTFCALLLLISPAAGAQEKAKPQNDELDVTMQIIVDPDAKLPDEIVRRIPLPVRKPAPQASTAAGGERPLPDAADKGQERAREAEDLGEDMAERARETAREAAEQRERARRSIAEERRRNPSPPADPPARPPR